MTGPLIVAEIGRDDAFRAVVAAPSAAQHLLHALAGLCTDAASRWMRPSPRP